MGVTLLTPYITLVEKLAVATSQPTPPLPLRVPEYCPSKIQFTVAVSIYNPYLVIGTRFRTCGIIFVRVEAGPRTIDSTMSTVQYGAVYYMLHGRVSLVRLTPVNTSIRYRPYALMYGTLFYSNRIII